MGKRIFDQLGGVIGVKISGQKQEKVINMALSRGIYIWDIKKEHNSIVLKVKASGYEALKSICEENDYILEITNKQGFPFFKGVFKRRVGFLSGALIFVASLYLLSSFIWFVDVSGNKQVEKKRILTSAAKYGVYEGAAKWGFITSEVEKAMHKELSELAYIKVGIDGVKANIEVVEKVFPQDEISGQCHMVASKDGVVKEVLVLDGQPAVKEGDVVARGEILISGIMFPSTSPFLIEENTIEVKQPYMVRARGTVKAEVNYQSYGECRLVSEETILTGNKKSRIYIEIPGRKIRIIGQKGDAFPYYSLTTEHKTVNTPIGSLSIYRETMAEQVKKKTEYSAEQAEKIAKSKAVKILSSRIKNQKVLNSKIEIISSPSDPILRIKLSINTIEDIAVARPFK
ncbi:MAG: sporulation protein YqfD [Syntrophomonadaceae bacterium]|nr:sporulation protein YqfD [Syntrophomonadaceae bacterium]MDD3023185.1 sporulation protein YqfD [Syntrophomonadaceae bacterium]